MIARDSANAFGALQPDDSPRNSVITGLAIAAIFAGAFGTWAALAPLSSAVIAPAVIKVEGNRKAVQHLEGGIVRDILVKEGERVEAGQTLIMLDDTQARGALELLSKQHLELRAQESRLLAEQAGAASIAFPPELGKSKSAEIARIVSSQTSLFHSRQLVLAGQINVTRQKIAQTLEQIAGAQGQLTARKEQRDSVRAELVGLKKLFEGGYVPRQRILELERNASALEGQIIDIAANIVKLQQSVQEFDLQIAQFRADRVAQVAADLRDAQARRVDLEPRLHVAEEVLKRMVVASPTAGRVVGLTAFTVGGVVAAGERIMEVVPDGGDFLVEATLKVEDQKDVQAGADAEVHLIAYKQRSAPVVAGTVVHVSADRLTDARTGENYYAAQIKLKQDDLHRLENVRLNPGMPALVIIPTGERTPVDYLLQPLTDAIKRALREK